MSLPEMLADLEARGWPGMSGQQVGKLRRQVENAQILADARTRREPSGRRDFATVGKISAPEGDSMGRQPREIIASAIERGAISHERAAVWQARADQGEDISVLDNCVGLDFVAAENARIGPRAGHVTASGWAAVYGGDVDAAWGRPNPGDPAYAANPLLAEVQRSRPALAAAARAENPNPPELFGSRSMPLVTASGIAPTLLLSLPWQIRRAVAAAPTMAAAYALIDQFGDDPGMASQDDEVMAHNAGYLSDFSAWLAGQGEAYDSGQPDERLYAEVFGPRVGAYDR